MPKIDTNFTAPTLEELKALKAKKEAENKRVKLAVSLKICPVCGGALIEEREEVLDKPEGWWIFKTTYKLWDYRLVCVVDKRHYEHKENYGSLYGNYYD